MKISPIKKITRLEYFNEAYQYSTNFCMYEIRLYTIGLLDIHVIIIKTKALRHR